MPKLVRNLAALVAVLLALSAISSMTLADTGISFTNFELGPFNQAGVVCPNSSGNCTNANAEPQIVSDRAGNFYASSEFLPPTITCASVISLLSPFCGGTGAWKSTDGGNHYTTLPSPNSLSFVNNSLSPWGGDTDIAAAPAKNQGGHYNVYVVSLERATGPLLNVEVSTTTDGGQTWAINPTGATVSIDDRPWVAADGQSKVCISYYAEALGSNAVSCSSDSGSTFTQAASTLDSNHAWLAFEDGEGNIAIDTNSHVVYVIFPGLATESEAVQCAVTCSLGFHALWVAVSIDGGATFTDHLVYNDPVGSASIGHQFPVVAVDKAGNVYAVFSDNHNVYLSHSTDFGGTWSAPVQVNQSPPSTAIEPWVTAGNPGMLDIVWYGTSYFDGVNPPDNYPTSAAWNVYFAQTTDGLGPSPTFTQVAASPINHYGGVCEGGVSCTGNRDLFDDFGVAASPVTGLASIVYSDDQYTNSASQPTPPLCTQSRTNTGACDRTNVATQVSGHGIFKKSRSFEIEMDTLEQVSNQPDFQLELTNTGNASITSISIQLAGLPLSVSWNTTLPLPVNSSIYGSTAYMPLGLVLVPAGVYSLTVTAAYSDGTAATQTVQVIYALV